MFSNNPNYVEKLVQAKQDDILRELPDPSTYEFEDAGQSTARPKIRYKIWVAVGLLAALAWLFGALL